MEVDATEQSRPIESTEQSRPIEVRWHGRGGQGAKTAAVLFAELAVAARRFVQAFPEYGPERMGAPVIAYNRLSQEPIIIRTPVQYPDYVVLVDPHFVGRKDMLAGLRENGAILANSGRTSGEVRRAFGLEDEGVRVYTLNASAISRETIGREIPNTPMVAALVRLTGLVGLDDLRAFLGERLHKKFRDRPKIVEGNLKALVLGYKEVAGE